MSSDPASSLLRIEEFKEEWKELESIYRFIVKEEVRDEQTGIS